MGRCRDFFHRKMSERVSIERKGRWRYHGIPLDLSTIRFSTLSSSTDSSCSFVAFHGIRCTSTFPRGCPITLQLLCLEKTYSPCSDTPPPPNGLVLFVGMAFVKDFQTDPSSRVGQCPIIWLAIRCGGKDWRLIATLAFQETRECKVKHTGCRKPVSICETLLAAPPGKHSHFGCHILGDGL